MAVIQEKRIVTPFKLNKTKDPLVSDTSFYNVKAQQNKEVFIACSKQHQLSRTL